MKRVVVGAVVAGTLLVGAIPSWAAISDPTPWAGQVVVVTGNGCRPGIRVAAKFDSVNIAADVANDNGAFASSVRIPLWATRGAHTLRTYCRAPNGRYKTYLYQLNVVGGGARVSDSTPAPGQTIRVSGDGCVANAIVRVRLGATALGSTRATSTGSYSMEVAIPGDLLSGRYLLSAYCFQPYPPGTYETDTTVIRVL